VLIPSTKLCECGCGKTTNINRQGKPYRFLKGHAKTPPHSCRKLPPCAPGLCACGCGGETNTHRGKPRKFIKGHHARGVNNSQFGKPRSAETKIKISEVRKQRGTTWWLGRQHTSATRKKMSASHIANYRKGRKNPFLGKHHTAESKAKVAKSKEKALKLPTKPERLVHEELKNLGLSFIPEYAIGPFNVDVVIPAIKTVIFVDGCYWHACPIHHPKRHKPISDNSRIPYLSKCGYKVIILWEHEILMDVQKSLQRSLAG